eukprot:g7827.t1
MQSTTNSSLHNHQFARRVSNRVQKRSLHGLSSRLVTVCFGGNFREGKRRSSERILRYPNGDTRLIRYPAIDLEAEPEIELKDTLHESFGETRTPSSKTKDLPSSPNELIELLRSETFRKAQEEQRRRIRESYELLEQCPWEMPLQLYLLAVDDPVSDSPQIYTLRTRIEQKSATEKLKRMFRGDGYKGQFINVERVTDGVICFFDYDNAERFKALIEAEDVRQVSICEMNSHQLFQATIQSHAVVVLMHCREYLPSINELTTSLRAQRSLEAY